MPNLGTGVILRPEDSTRPILPARRGAKNHAVPHCISPPKNLHIPQLSQERISLRCTLDALIRLTRRQYADSLHPSESITQRCSPKGPAARGATSIVVRSAQHNRMDGPSVQERPPALGRAGPTRTAAYSLSSYSESGGMHCLRPLRLRMASTISIGFSADSGSAFIVSRWWKTIWGKAWPPVFWRRKEVKPNDSETGRYALMLYSGVPGRFVS